VLGTFSLKGRVRISGTLVCKNAAGEVIEEIGLTSSVPLTELIDEEQRKQLATRVDVAAKSEGGES
jgi:hypothetical protein